MTEISGQKGPVDQKPSPMIDRETFRKVVRQRQRMKADLRELQEKIALLPENWEERLPGWLEQGQVKIETIPEKADASGESDMEPVGGSEGDEKGQKAMEEVVDDPVREAAGPEAAAEPTAEALEWAEKERTYRRTIADLSLSGLIREAAKELGAYDPQDVVDLTRGFFQASYDQGGLMVGPGEALGGSGIGRYFSQEGQEFTLEGVVKRFLETKPHLVKASLKPGSGLVPEPLNPLAGGSVEMDDRARNRLAERLRLQGRLD